METHQSALRVYRSLVRVLVGAIPIAFLLVGFAVAQSISPGPSSFIHPGGRTASPAAPMPGLRANLAEDPAVPIFHSADQLVCSQCHTMHASQQHEYSASAPPDPFGPTPRTFTPSAYLLKASDPINLCITCHDGQANIPDVIKEDTNGLTERSAGFFDAVDADNYKGHKLKTGLSTNGGRLNGLCQRCHFGGTFADAGVTCIDCHNPHGNNRVRNLQWASDPGGEPPFGLFMANSALGNMARYEAANIGYGTSNSTTLREVTNICLDCHHVFSGGYYIDRNSNGIHERHPTYDSERSSINSIAQGTTRGTTDPTHWQSGTGSGFTNTPRLRFVTNGALNFADAKVIDATKNGVFCLSCHKAHGSQHAFALTWNPIGATAVDGCEQCHNKR